MSADVYIGLGANLGNPLTTFEKCLPLIEEYSEIISRSKLYRSAPYGFADQPPFINAAIRIETNLPPLDLLKKLQETEKTLGKKVIRRNGPRVIDLDLLLYDELSLDNDDLVLPHPRILNRDFVLRPLLDLNPELSHPFWAPKTLKSALSELQQKFVENDPKPWEITD